MLFGNSYHKLQSDHPRSNITKTRRSKSRSSITTASRLPPVPEQSKTKTALTMKVKELRNWLSELGDKNQEHYHRFHHHSPKAPSYTKPTTVVEGGDLLGIQSKPSMASSCPSTAILEDTNDPLFAASFSSNEDDDESSSSNQEGKRNDLYKRNEKSAIKKLCHDEGVEEHFTTKDHLALLLKQAPRTQEEGFCSVSRGDDGSYDDDRDENESALLRTNQGLRKPLLFRDQILTKERLDSMSRSPDPVKVPKTLGEQLQQLKEKQNQESDSEKDCFYHGDDDDDEGDSKTDSRESADAPSIGPSVLVSKIANVFLNNYAATTFDSKNAAPPPAPERRKHVDPKDLSFLRSSDSSSFATTPREDLDYANPPKTPTTTVGKGIRKFGGPRKTLVERRTEQLHEKYGETRSAIFVQKKTWGQKAAYGKYQRTTTVEKLYK